MSRNRHARRQARQRREPRSLAPAHAELDAVYAQIPDVGCRGLCVEACGSIGQTALEQKRIADHGGVLLPLLGKFEDSLCPALKNDRCSVYANRPTVCRLWGAVDPMPCQYGCTPTDGAARLSTEEGRRLIERAQLISDRAMRAQRDDR